MGYAVAIANHRAGKPDYYRNPSKYWVKPFNIAGNLWYVGDSNVCSHLIDTGDGLIVIDSGYPTTIAHQWLSICMAGFDPHDVKYLITTHGHYDHFGGWKSFRDTFGTKVLLSAADAQMLRERPDRALMDCGPTQYAEVVVPDIEINDGDVIKLGDTEIKCVLSPGHTPGTMTFLFDVPDKDKTYKAALLGGVGFLTIYKDCLDLYGLPRSLQTDFLKTLDKLRAYSPDINLGNHPAQNQTLEKMKKIKENPQVNPFIDKNEWQEFLSRYETNFKKFLAEGN